MNSVNSLSIASHWMITNEIVNLELCLWFSIHDFLIFLSNERSFHVRFGHGARRRRRHDRTRHHGELPMQTSSPPLSGRSCGDDPQSRRHHQGRSQTTGTKPQRHDVKMRKRMKRDVGLKRWIVTSTVNYSLCLQENICADLFFSFRPYLHVYEWNFLRFWLSIFAKSIRPSLKLWNACQAVFVKETTRRKIHVES